MGQIFEAGGPFRVTGGPFGPPVNMLAEALLFASQSLLVLMTIDKPKKLLDGKHCCIPLLDFSCVPM